MPFFKTLKTCPTIIDAYGTICGIETQPDTRLCDTHNCYVRNCPRPASIPLGTCSRHTCNAHPHGNRCPEAVAQPDMTRYCYGHKCEVAGCKDQRRGGVPQKYCAKDHACAVYDCTECRCGHRSAYCQMHKCCVTDCRAEAAVPGGFCRANLHGPHDVGFVELCAGADRAD